MRAAAAASAGSTWRWPRRWSARRGTGRAATIEWEPVDSLTAWRFGLATATGMVPPDRLLNAASPQLRAFQARAPLLTPQQRLSSALIAAGLGVFSSQSLIDLYSAIYDSTDPGDLSETDAWQLRQAFVGKDVDARMAAIRKLLAIGKDGFQKEAARALAARAATLIEPDPKLAKDAPELISAMLAAGLRPGGGALDAGAIGEMDDADCRPVLGDACAWQRRTSPMSARAGSPASSAATRAQGECAARCWSRGSPGSAGSTRTPANSLNRRYGLGLSRQSSWTQMIDAAAGAGPGGHGAGADRHRASDVAVPDSCPARTCFMRSPASSVRARTSPRG